ncbi:MAG: tetratricopeptide repeat protein [Acidobacteriota bacterium]
MSRRRRLALPVAMLLSTVTACASSQSRVNSTENRTATLEAKVADLEATQQNIIARLTQLRQDLQNALDPMRTQQADRGEDFRDLEAQVTALREQLLLLNERLTGFSERAGTGPLPATPPPTGVPMPAPRAKGNAGGQAGSEAGAAEPPAKSEQETIFDAAFLDYLNDEPVLAIDGFQEYLRRYPDSEHADDALYWIGECQAAQDDHVGSRASFLNVTTRYPDADKVPDAMLRAALEAIELGRPRQAIRELRQLVAAHPRTDAALIGCLQLGRLGEELPQECPSPGLRPLGARPHKTPVVELSTPPVAVPPEW